MDLDTILDTEFLKSLISDFDLMAILPDMADVMNWIVTLVGYAVVIGPILLAFMGLWYLLLPARESNHILGYRFFWGMGSVKSWKFTQRFAGLAWAITGIVLALNANEFREQSADLEKLDMMYQAIVLILHQVYYLVVVSLGVNVCIFLLFNFRGEYRRLWVFLGNWIKEQVGKLMKPKADKPKKEHRQRTEKNQKEIQQ